MGEISKTGQHKAGLSPRIRRGQMRGLIIGGDDWIRVDEGC